MNEDEEKAEILIRVLSMLFGPNPGFDVSQLAAEILKQLALVGWSLSYDPSYTQEAVQRVVAAVKAQHPTPTVFVPPQPPERLS